MVKQIKNRDQSAYQCELCDMGYRDIETAERCEEYCGAHGSCSLEITKEAVYKPPVPFMP